MKLEYYLYNRETDQYIYNYDFKKLYKIYNELNSFGKILGVTVLDDDDCTMLDDILFEHKEL